MTLPPEKIGEYYGSLREFSWFIADWLPEGTQLRGNAAEHAVGSRGRHSCHASSAYDDGPGAQPGAWGLVHGHRFTGEHGLVDQQGGHFCKFGVGDDDVTFCATSREFP